MAYRTFGFSASIQKPKSKYELQVLLKIESHLVCCDLHGQHVIINVPDKKEITLYFGKYLESLPLDGFRLKIQKFLCLEQN